MRILAYRDLLHCHMRRMAQAIRRFQTVAGYLLPAEPTILANGLRSIQANKSLYSG